MCDEMRKPPTAVKSTPPKPLTVNMVRGASLVLLLALAWACEAQGSVLVPTYVLPPDSFVRDQRSLDASVAESQRTIRRLIGGHMKIKSEKEYGNPSKNSFAYDAKSESGKFAGVIVPDQSGGSVGWNQGIWDDGMLMSSAGEGKEVKGTKTNRDDDEDVKTLSDQVAEGKYGLLQNEIFAKTPKRPGIVSYEANPETRSKDNLQSLGGLKKEEIWLAEDHLLVLKGGSFPERVKDADKRPWPPIDNYEAPRRQVKLPQKPKVPPPFPVQLSDDGPLVFLTPNGSVPAPIFPPFPSGEGEGPLPPSPYPFPPGSSNTPGAYPGNFTSGGAPFPIPPFPFLPGNASEGPFFPFPPSMNSSFPDGFPPGAAFLPPPSNQTDLYDEDDPSIYYPPPYNFSYHADYTNRVPAGPLVPGIVLPPPPDFFAPAEEKSTTERVTTKEPVTSTTFKSNPSTKRPYPTPIYRKPYKKRPTTTESYRYAEEPSTISTPPTVETVTTPKVRPQTHIVEIPSRKPVRVHNLPDDIITRPKTEKPAYKTRTKLTSKPLSVAVVYEEPIREPPKASEKPYIVYRLPEKTADITDNLVTSTPVPLRAYYSPQNEVPTTKLQPVYNRRPTEHSIASFYFYDEQPKSSPKPTNYYDGRNYYKTVPAQPSQAPHVQSHNVQAGFNPAIDVSYGAFDQTDAFFLWPQKQGPRTLTQEYFSIQKPKHSTQQQYVQPPKRPDFYQQIADIQQTFELFSTPKPKTHSHRPHTLNAHKPKAITSRPVYQYSYQTKPRQEQLFRAPKLDPEPFRPMVSYSKPFNLQSEFNTITPSVSSGYHQQYLIENVQVTTETPTSSRYYPKTKAREDDYDDTPPKPDNKNRNHIQAHSEKPSPASVVSQSYQQFAHTTPSAVSHGYYTQQDERYLDDITKNSFDIFGKKIEDSHDVHGLAVTPPLATVRTPIDNDINIRYAYEVLEPNAPSLDRDTVVNERFPRPPINPNSEPLAPTHSQLQQKPPSLLHDTQVNDRAPRPPVNPDSEFIPIPNPGYRAQYVQVAKQYAGEQYDLNQPSLGGDTAVNYKRPLPAVNPDAEWIQPVNAAGEGRPGSFVSYRLPGDGAHVYFLTPQAAQAARERHRAPGYGR